MRARSHKQFAGVIFTIFLTFASLRFATSQAPPPHIFYTDLVSGPATGGESDEGAFVSLYGDRFGSTRGEAFVTIGDKPAFGYPEWTDNKVVIQIGRNAHSGQVIVHLPKHLESNGEPFVVRKGKIYFVSKDGDDDHAGSFAHPWKTVVDAKDKLDPGDILYLMDGVEQIVLEKYSSSLSIQTSGRPGEPIAIVAYPGAHVTIGTFSGPEISARTPNIDRTSDHWVLAGLTFHGAQEALDITASKDWRLVGNDFSCPEGFGPTGCIELSQATDVAFLGNTIHDVAKPRTTKVYHALYFSTDSNHIDVGWNTIANVRGCRAIQFHSTPLDPGTGLNQYDLHIHDNTIHDVVCDGINLATIDASKGAVEVYNNLLYNIGTGPDPEDGSADYACIYIQGGSNAGPPGSGTVEIYNNTFFNCGSRKNTDSGALALSAGSPEQHVRLQNNIIVLHPGVPLISPNSPIHTFFGARNVLWFSAEPLARHSPLPQGFLSYNPLLKDPTHGDFTLRSGSTAISGGTPVNLAYDIRGVPRDPSEHPDIGAFQHTEGEVH